MKFIIGKELIEGAKLHSWALDARNKKLPDWQLEIAYSVCTWFDDNPFVLMKTSGSTGKPKEIRLSKKSMVQSCKKTAQAFGLSAGMTFLNCLPVRYIAGHMMVIRAIVLGADEYCVEPKLCLSNNLPSKLDFVAMTPLQVKHTLNVNPSVIDKMDNVIIGGAPISTRLQKRLQNIRAKCYLTYGMTETITHVAIQKINGPDKNSFFEALPGVKFSELDGRLKIMADHLSQPIFTNDNVELIDNTRFRWIGRKDNVINKGGVKIQPEYLEAKLAHAIKDRFIFTSVEDRNFGQDLVMVIESRKYKKEEMTELNDVLIKLDKLEIPSKIIFIDKFAETTTGKVKRDINLYLM